MNRQPGGLARDIPEGDVDDAHRDRVDEVAEVVQTTPVAPDLERIGSQQQRLHERDDLARDRQRARARIAQEVRALDSRRRSAIRRTPMGSFPSRVPNTASRGDERSCIAIVMSVICKGGSYGRADDQDAGYWLTIAPRRHDLRAVRVGHRQVVRALGGVGLDRERAARDAHAAVTQAAHPGRARSA